MISQEFRANRARFPRDELQKHQGSWVAFSADGCRIVASAESIDQLEAKLALMGDQARGVALEWVVGPDDDCQIGASELY